MVKEDNDRVIYATTECCNELMSMMSEKFAEIKNELEDTRRSKGRSAGHASEFSGSWGSSRSRPESTPRRPAPKAVEKRSRCPFCTRFKCTDPVGCGFKLSLPTRLSIHRKKNLCAQKTCYKQHAEVCFKEGKVRCTACGGPHLNLWCAFLAKKQGKL